MGTLPAAGVQGQHFAVCGRGLAAVRSLGFARVQSQLGHHFRNV